MKKLPKKPPLFKKAIEYCKRFMDCIQVIQCTHTSFFYNTHKSYHFQKEENGVIFLRCGEKYVFAEHLFHYYPQNINIKNTTKCIELKEHFDLDSVDEEFEFQLSTLYTDKEIIDIYISTIMFKYGYKGHLNYSSINLGKYTKAVTNVRDYIHSKNNAHNNEKLCTLRYTSDLLKVI